MKTNVSLNISDKDYLALLNVSVMLRTELRKFQEIEGGEKKTQSSCFH